MASGIHYISFISPEQDTSGIKEEKHYEKQTDRTPTMSALAVGGSLAGGNTVATDTAASGLTQLQNPRRGCQQLLRLLKPDSSPQTSATNMQIFPVPSACPVPLHESWQT